MNDYDRTQLNILNHNLRKLNDNIKNNNCSSNEGNEKLTLIIILVFLIISFAMFKSDLRSAFNIFKNLF